MRFTGDQKEKIWKQIRGVSPKQIVDNRIWFSISSELLDLDVYFIDLCA